MSQVKSRKVVDISTGAVLFNGTWAQCVNYCIHNKLGKYYEFGWLDHVVDTNGKYEIREAKQ